MNISSGSSTRCLTEENENEDVQHEIEEEEETNFLENKRLDPKDAEYIHNFNNKEDVGAQI